MSAQLDIDDVCAGHPVAIAELERLREQGRHPLPMSDTGKIEILIGATYMRRWAIPEFWSVEFPPPTGMQHWSDDDVSGAILDALADGSYGPRLWLLTDGWCAAVMCGDGVVESPGHETRLAALLAVVEAVP